jgi:hypothetical protein
MEITPRLGGIGALAFAATLVAGFALDGAIAITTGGPPQLFLSSLSADLTRSGGSAVWRVELWTYIAAIVPFAFFVPGLRVSLSQRSAALADIGAVTGILFIVFHTVHNIAYAAIVTGLAPSYVPGTAAGIATEQVARGLIALAESAFLPGGGIGGALLVAFLGTFGIAQRREGMRAAGAVALVAAALSALGYLGVFVGLLALPIALAGWVGVIAWAAMTGRALLSASALGLASYRAGRRSEAAATSRAG